MAYDNLAKLRVSIWKDYTPPRSLMIHQDHGKQLGGDDILQQEVYSWSMREDPFGGVADEALRNELRELLVVPFQPSNPPSQRRISKMEPFLLKAEEAIQNGVTEWTVSLEGAGDDDDFPARVNPLLALNLQLKWLVRSFGHQPGVSVAIR
ncbi:hypothetical protein [Peteryoungia algae]|uniref:Uncharacterized protein n=1 Tax=Peteryoungia algae TaxID=2919917 RepID=A0ABT0CXB3_9HYPH|nr:hypothetical protein [Rhizobium sp. SSM4.3]MCJ8237801.1 hypothetical protein [Rhizobium sp. SSM4.3]